MAAAAQRDRHQISVWPAAKIKKKKRRGAALARQIIIISLGVSGENGEKSADNHRANGSGLARKEAKNGSNGKKLAAGNRRGGRGKSGIHRQTLYQHHRVAVSALALSIEHPAASINRKRHPAAAAQPRRTCGGIGCLCAANGGWRGDINQLVAALIGRRQARRRNKMAAC